MNRETDLATALGRWAAFPVDQSPRPVVLIGSAVEATSGFATVGANEAFHAVNVSTDVPLPTGLLTRLGTPDHQHTGPTLRITSAELVEWGFSTDRGQRALPAWELMITDARGPVYVLDPSITPWWPAGDRFFATYSSPSRTVAGSLNLTYHFVRSPVRFAEITAARAIETSTAVAVDVTLQRRESHSRNTPLFAEDRETTVALKAPLGARVLLNPTGYPLPVLTNAGRDGDEGTSEMTTRA